MNTKLVFEEESAEINNAVFLKSTKDWVSGCRKASIKRHYPWSWITKVFLTKRKTKAVSQLTDQHKAQVRNYIGIAEKRLGLLYNFNERYMTPVRILNSNLRDYCGN